MSNAKPAEPDYSSPLELDPEAFRALGYRAVDLAAEYLATIRDRPVFTPMSEEQRAALRDASLSETGEAATDLIDGVAREIFRFPMGNGHPRFFGWINSPPAPIGAVAEFLASVSGPSCAGGDHAAIYMEKAAVSWLMDLVGFPSEGSMGLLVSGGSMASLTGLAAAREWVTTREGWSARESGLWSQANPLTLYVSTEGHTTIRKAAHLLGLGEASVRLVPVDRAYGMDVEALRAAIGADRGSGHRPFCVVASAGTAGTGAIDPIDAIADLCEDEDLWLHVDGAYGGIGVVDPSVAPLYAGMERADSVAIDPHKWLSVPVECGCVLVRDGSLLRETFSLVPPYVLTEEGKGIGGPPWFSEFGFHQTRGFRALKLWMVLRQLGRDGVRAHVARSNQLARRLAALVRAASDFELTTPVSLSIVCFRYVPVGWEGSDGELSDLNQAIMYDVQESGEAFLTSTVIDGQLSLRACVLHFGTTEGDLVALLDAVRSSARRVMGRESWPSPHPSPNAGRGS
jgi:aromatic-L-amino-acid/L-tryptophan decarboxylase